MTRPSLPTRPEVTDPAPWTFPIPEEFTLANGLAVQLFHLPGQHVVSAGLSVAAPLSAEARRLEGVGTITAGVLDQGTRSHPDESFAEAVERCGAVLEASTGYSAAQVYLDVPAGHLGTALPLLAEAVREPELTDEAVDRERGLLLAQLEQQWANSSSRADHAWRAAVIDAGCRASRPKTGLPDTLGEVRATDVRSFHESAYRPDGATLVLAGELPRDARRQVEDAFSSWFGAQGRPAEQEVAVPGPRRALLVHRPGSVQADVRYGRFTIDRTDPRWADFTLGAHALGGAFLSRLNSVLREEKGYTYGVHLVTSPMRHGGYTAVQGSFRTEVVSDAVALMGPLLDLSSSPLTPAELDASRRFLLGVQPLQYATASGVANGALTLIAAGLDTSFVDRVRHAFVAVTPESASAAASALLPTDDLTLVVVGDADALDEPLASAGFVTEVVTDDRS